MSAAQEPENVNENPSGAQQGAAAEAPAPKEPQRALAKPPKSIPHGGGSLSRAADAARTVLPLVQKVLPLLEGNVAGAVVNLLTPGPVASGGRADLKPLEHALAKLKVENRELRDGNAEQDRTLKKLEEKLGELKAETERQGERQRELARELASARGHIKALAWVSLSLLAVCLASIALLLTRSGLF